MSSHLRHDSTRPRLVATTITLLALVAAAPLPARAGAGELSLDRAAVAAIVEAGTPSTIPVDVPALGSIDLRLRPTGRLAFVDGGIETSVDVSSPMPGLSGRVELRYVPRIDEEKGLVRLVAERVQVNFGGRLPFQPDIRSLLPPIELQRAYDWIVEPEGLSPRRMTLHVQDVTVSRERLVVSFGLLTRAARAAGKGR